MHLESMLGLFHDDAEIYFSKARGSRKAVSQRQAARKTKQASDPLRHGQDGGILPSAVDKAIGVNRRIPAEQVARI